MSKPILGPFPAILERRFNMDASSEDREAVFRALVERYGAHNKLLRETEEPSRGHAFWRALAESLMYDLIPAYQPNKADAQLLLDWVHAGGDVLRFFDHPARRRHFYEAQFVSLIQGLENSKGRSRYWVYRWLAHEVDQQGPKERKRRASLMPHRYRRRSNADSIKEAYNSIPRSVRMNPLDYLPVAGPAGLGAAVLALDTADGRTARLAELTWRRNGGRDDPNPDDGGRPMKRAPVVQRRRAGNG